MQCDESHLLGLWLKMEYQGYSISFEFLNLKQSVSSCKPMYTCMWRATYVNLFLHEQTEIEIVMETRVFNVISILYSNRLTDNVSIWASKYKSMWCLKVNAILLTNIWQADTYMSNVLWIQRFCELVFIYNVGSGIIFRRFLSLYEI